MVNIGDVICCVEDAESGEHSPTYYIGVVIEAYGDTKTPGYDIYTRSYRGFKRLSWEEYPFHFDEIICTIPPEILSQDIDVIRLFLALQGVPHDADY